MQPFGFCVGYYIILIPFSLLGAHTFLPTAGCMLSEMLRISSHLSGLAMEEVLEQFE